MKVQIEQSQRQHTLSICFHLYHYETGGLGSGRLTAFGSYIVRSHVFRIRLKHTMIAVVRGELAGMTSADLTHHNDRLYHTP